jgi:hypothetical protein
MPRQKASTAISKLKDDIERAKTAHVEANKLAAAKNASEAQKANVKTTADKLAKLQADYRRDAFKEFATIRGTKVIKGLGSLQSLANRRSYTFDSDDVEVLREAIKTAFSETMSVFDSALQSQPNAAPVSFAFTFK